MPRRARAGVPRGGARARPPRGRLGGARRLGRPARRGAGRPWSAPGRRAPGRRLAHAARPREGAAARTTPTRRFASSARDLRRARSRAARLARDRRAPHDADMLHALRNVDRSPPSPASPDAAARSTRCSLARAARTSRPRARSRCPLRRGSTRSPPPAGSARTEVEPVGARATRARGAHRRSSRRRRGDSRDALRASEDQATTLTGELLEARSARRRRGARDGLPPRLRRRAQALSHRLQRHQRSARRRTTTICWPPRRASRATSQSSRATCPSRTGRARSPDDPRVRRAGAPVVGRHDVRVPDALAADAEPAGHLARPDLRPRGRRRRSTTAARPASRGASPSRPSRASTRSTPTSTSRSACPASASSAASRTTRWSRRTRRCWRVSLRPRAVLDNMQRLEAMGMLGTYGLFEAVDMHADRVPRGARRSRSCARTWRTTRGCSCVALGNLLNDRIMVERFHADPEVADGRAPAQRARPDTAPREWPIAEHAESAGAAPVDAPSRAPSPWMAAAQGRPQAFVLSNGRLSSLVTDSGGGGLRWEGLALTRYQPDVDRRRRRRLDLPARRGERPLVARGLRAKPHDLRGAQRGVPPARPGDLGARRRGRRDRRRRRGAADHAAQRDGPHPAAHGDQRGRARAPPRGPGRDPPGVREDVRRERSGGRPRGVSSSAAGRGPRRRTTPCSCTGWSRRAPR